MPVTVFDLVLLANKKQKSNNIKENVNSKEIKSISNVNNSNNNNNKAKKFSSNRPKRLSSLKKRILLERLRHHIESNNNSFIPISDIINDSNKVLVINDFISIDEVNDEDEREEVIANVKCILNSFGQVNEVIISVDSEEARVLVTFNDKTSVSYVARSIDNMLVGGKHIRTSVTSSLTNESIVTNTSTESTRDIVSSSLVNLQANNIVSIENLVMRDDVKDSDEAIEIIQDIRRMCSEYGTVNKVWLEENHSQLIRFDSIEGSKWIALQLNSLENAMKALVSLSMNCFDVYLYDGLTNECSDSHCLSIGFTFALLLVDFVNVDEVIDDDERQAVVDDIIELINQSSLLTVHMTVSFTAGSSSSSAHALIYLPSLEESLTILRVMSAKIVQGDYLRCQLVGLTSEIASQVVMNQLSDVKYSLLFDPSNQSIRHIVVVKGLIDSSNDITEKKHQVIQSSNCQINDIMRVTVWSTGPSSSVTGEITSLVTFSDDHDALETLIRLDGEIVGGNVISVHKRSSIIESSQDTIPIVVSTNNTNSTTIESKYKQMRLTPKLPKHAMPSITNVPIADEETNELIFTMLDSLATYQSRLKERDPINYKLKLRFVVGMKQVTTAIKANKAKIVLIAPDTEKSESIDSLIQSLITAAISNEIPVIYCLSRRKLAKACHLSMRQAAVAVYDPNGAYPLYKRIIRYIEKYVTDRDKIETKVDDNP